MKTPSKIYILFFFLFFLLGNNSYAVTCTSTGTDWGNTAHWSCGIIPTGSDIVIINTNMILDRNLTRTALMTINAGASLVGDFTITIGQSTGSAAGTLLNVAGTLSPLNLSLQKADATISGTLRTTCSLSLINQTDVTISGFVLVLGNLFADTGNISAIGSGSMRVRGCIEATSGKCDDILVKTCVQQSGPAVSAACATAGCTNGGSDNCIPAAINGANPDTNPGNCLTILPITLTYFISVYDDKNGRVIFEWQTANETNNKIFILERSVDGINFSQIEYIDAVGNSTTAVKYKVFDKNPLYGINYYRLKQVDFDGKFTYSHLVAAKVSNVKPAFEMYPNPSSNEVNLKFGVEERTNVLVRIYTLLGELIYEQTFYDNDGSIILELGKKITQGLYIVKLETQNNAFQAKLQIKE